MKKATLLLTATVQPGKVVMCERHDKDTRLADYLFALKFWLGEPLVSRIVLVENSGFDLAPFQRLASWPRYAGKQMEMLGFKQAEYDPALGKSYGEAKIIEYALANSRILGEAEFVIKGTGRYYPTNFFKVWPKITQNPFPFIMANYRVYPGVCDSRFFGCAPAFLRDYLLPASVRINDEQGYYFEHALAVAVERAIADGKTFSLLPSGGFLVDGVQASGNVVFPYPYWKRMLYRLYASYRNGVPFQRRLGAPVADEDARRA